MDTIFDEIIDLVDTLRIHMRTRVFPQDTQTNELLSKLQKQTERFVQIAKKEPELASFTEEHIGLIYRIYDTLVGDFGKVHGGNGMEYRRLCDKIMNALNIKRPMSRFASVPALFLEHLLRGITYFESDEDVDWPRYHRKQSCGKKTQTYLEKFKIYTDDSKRIVDKKKAALQKCYIERLVYNELHHRILHRQDTGHLVELRNIQQLWQDYFPGEEIFVKVEYDEYNLPMSLHIYHQDANMRRTEDIYRKDESGVVHCYRDVYRVMKRISPLRLERYKKLQTFEKEEPWNKPIWRSVG
jgi:hypothetical protein